MAKYFYKCLDKQGVLIRYFNIDGQKAWLHFGLLKIQADWVKFDQALVSVIAIGVELGRSIHVKIAYFYHNAAG